jgi:L-threonylcarbamoyladenylate synthase
MIKLNTSPAEIEKAAAVLKSGGLVAFPTETVYGLGADAFNSRALARVFEVKRRPHFDPLIIHIGGIDALGTVANLGRLNARQKKQLDLLVGSFWPGPLTIVLPRRKEVPGLAAAGLPTAAVRFPSNPIAQQLIRLSTGAVAAPSANPFGRLSPSRAEHVIETLGGSIDCIIDGGPCPVGVESTVLELFPTAEPAVPRILRPGGISREQLEAVLGTVEKSAGHSKDGFKKNREESAVLSPGMLKNHYAPLIPLYLHSPGEMALLPFNKNEGYLFFSVKGMASWKQVKSGGQLPDNQTGAILALSENADTCEAAANLFEYLHLLEKSGVSCIHAETLPMDGLGEAVNDRLRRASL